MSKKKIASYDVFETVLFRKIGSLSSMSYELGRRTQSQGYLSISPEVFSRARIKAEKRAFENAGGLDSYVSLQQIYRELAFAFRIDNSLAEKILSMELELESETILPCDKILQEIENNRVNNRKIIFVSDTYFSPEFIKQQLAQHGAYREDDSLYVSSQLGKSKHTGSLYDYIVKQEGVSALSITHRGNHVWSDSGAARKSGLGIEPFLDGNFNRYESILDQGNWETGGISGILASASRLSRLSITGDTVRSRVLRDISAGVAGPIITDIIIWILRRAHQSGLKKIFFVSRDGQVFVNAARTIARKLNFDIDISYLYGSRQAWLLPSVSEFTVEVINDIYPEKFDVWFRSVQTILARFEIKPEEVSRQLEDTGFRKGLWESRLSKDQNDKLRRLIMEDSSIQDLILHKAQQRREDLIQYLKQEGAIGENFGFVDLGTGATLHNALSAVLASVDQPTPTSFYLGRRTNIKDIGYGLPEVYLNDGCEQLGYFIDSVTFLLEMFCCADHGGVTGYTKKGNIFLPQLEPENNAQVVDWGHGTVWKTIDTFAEFVCVTPYLDSSQMDVRPVLNQLIDTFLRTPTKEEAEHWGAYPFEDGWAGQTYFTNAALAYGLKDIVKAALQGKSPIRRNTWHMGSLFISPWYIQLTYHLFSRLGFYDDIFNRVLKKLKRRMRISLPDSS